MADDSQEIDAGNDFSKLKVVDLKRMLKSKGLSTSGNKQELVDRLQQSDAAFDELLEGTVPGEDGFDEEEIDEAALMKDDALEVKEVEGIEEKLEVTKVEEEVLAEGEPLVKKKKLSINRTVPEEPLVEEKEEALASGDVSDPSIPADSSTNGHRSISEETEDIGKNKDDVGGGGDEGEIKDEEEEDGSKKSDAGEKKIIKIKNISSLVDDKHKKLSLRAQRFGLSETAKKELRAARFGISNKITGPDSDLLKKRAERFGLPASAKEKSELQKKLQMRKERFEVVSSGQANKTEEGVAMAATITSLTPANLEDKKALRAKRFKIATTS